MTASPRHSAVKKVYPRLGPERTNKIRARGQDELLDCITDSRKSRQLSRTACDMMTLLTRKADWETGVLFWSNELWCEMLGITKSVRVREREDGSKLTDKTPFKLRETFKELLDKGLIERDWLKAHSDELVKGTEAWKHGLRATRRLVWDKASYEKCLTSATATRPDPKRSDPDPIQNDRIRIRSKWIGSGSDPNGSGLPLDPHLERLPLTGVVPSPSYASDHPFSSSSQTPARSAGETPAASPRDVSAAPTGLSSRSADAEVTRPLEADREERAAVGGGRANAVPPPSGLHAVASAAQSADESGDEFRADAELVAAYHRQRILRLPKAAKLAPDPEDLARIAMWRAAGWSLVDLLQVIEGAARNPLNQKSPALSSLEFLFRKVEVMKGARRFARMSGVTDDWRPSLVAKPPDAVSVPGAISEPHGLTEEELDVTNCEPELAASILEAHHARREAAEVRVSRPLKSIARAR